MRRASYSPLDQNPPFVADPDGQGTAGSISPDEEKEAPSWANFRQRILSFTRGRSKSPTSRSPGSKSPCRSPTRRSPASRSPASRSPTSRSPASRSPASKSPTSRSPSSRSPTCQSPNRSPTSKSPPLRSPTKHWSPVAPLALTKRGSFSRGSSRESRGSRESPTGGAAAEFAEVSQVRRNSGSKVKRCLKKAFSLNLEGGEVEDTGELGSPIAAAGAVGTGGRKVKLKIRSSPVEQVLEMTQLEDEESQAAALNRARKWSYHGTATPASPVEAPKRHSFSTGTGRSGIVVTNNDLASLLGPTHRLTPPGVPLPEDVVPMPPPLPNPRARGRSQSIAYCWDVQQNPAAGAKPESGVPITIRRTDCDHIAASSLDYTEEEEEAGEDSEKEVDEEGKLLWDSSGSTIDASLLGSVIESFLKTSKEDEASGSVTSSLKGLQVK
ncbi:serine/arginine repetitive matrix protein 2-like [Macrobrachium nipponense]|uniref:serine/arginine repetitive matrix protein 2-like n=1 Tax=Macrobrachium nipponense TaxID=159736 RepID=UPI0030C7E2B3